MDAVRILIMAVLLAMVAGFTTAEENSQEFQLMVIGEEYAPYSYLLDNEPAGLSVDLVEKITTDLGIPFQRNEVTLHSWQEVFDATVKGNRTLLLAVYRTPDREDLMQWVGPIATDSSAFFVKSGSDKKIDTVEDIKTLKISVIAGDAHESLLADYGVTADNIVTAANLEALIALVGHDDVDALFHGEQAVTWKMKELDLKNPLEVAFRLDEQNVWFGLSTDVPETTIDSLQASLNSIQLEENTAEGRDMEIKVTDVQVPSSDTGEVYEF
jgi:polar amino acid transport system substrate-binding protein